MFFKLFVLLIVCIKFGFAHDFKDILTVYLQNKFKDRILENILPQSTECAFALRETLIAASNGKLWALRLLDASSKLQSGLAEGNIVNLGSFHECMSVKEENSNYQINGKYCLYNLVLPPGPSFNISTVLGTTLFEEIKSIEMLKHINGLPLLGAVCIPNSCTAEDLYDIYNYSKAIMSYPMIQPYFDETFCQSINEEHSFSTLEILTLILLAGIGLLLISATAYDIYLLHYQKNRHHEMLLCFSLCSNVKELITVKPYSDQIPCINGIRFISMMWIILGHRYVICLMFPYTNYLYIVQTWLKEQSSAIATGATASVDTFFVLSGILAMHVGLLGKHKEFNFSLINYYLHRGLRLGPAMSMVILIYVTFLRYFGYGPLWPQFIDYLVGACENNWWKSLLYIQNFQGNEPNCVSQSWYLAVEMQLYILAPFLFIPIRHWPKTIVTAMVLLIFTSCIMGFVTAWNTNANVTLFSVLINWENLYSSTVVRMNAWFIGALLGYILIETREKSLRINKVVVICLWVLSLAVMASVVFIIPYFSRTPYNKSSSSFYFGFARAAWSLGLSWIIFACYHGYGGIINKFLSMKIFIVLARLTYSVYLVHVGVLAVIIGSKSTASRFSNITFLHDFWGDLVFVLVVGLFWNLAFETPLTTAGKMLINAISNILVPAKKLS